VNVIQSILVDRMFGPIGNLVAYPGPLPGTATIQRRKRRTDKSHHNQSCKAFKLADAVYHNFTDCTRSLWRAAQRHTKKSGYDYWMTHAVPNIAAGYYPPAIPATPGGYRKGHLPPGPYYIPNLYKPYIPNQTCRGPIAWDWTTDYMHHIRIQTAIDLRHPDDDNNFNVTISRWLLWDPHSETWLLNDVNRVVDDNWTNEDDLGIIVPVDPFISTGVIEIVYANLRQRFYIDAGTPIHVPIPLCSDASRAYCTALSPETVFPPGTEHFWKTPNAFAQFNLARLPASTPRRGRCIQLEPQPIIQDYSGADTKMANFHVVGHWNPKLKRVHYDWHVWKYQRLPRPTFYPAPYDFTPTGRTIIVYDGAAFTFNWRDNQKLSLTITTPQKTPKIA